MDRSTLKISPFFRTGKSSKTEKSPRYELRHMNDDENKPADKDAPRGMSDELVDGDTFDITDDPAKEEEESLEPIINPPKGK